MSLAFDRLRQFLQRDMRMSHLYQPLMLKTLLNGNGRASTRQIAAAFLAEDESQLDYYQAVTNRMPGLVLRRHGLVVKDGDGYALAKELTGLSKPEKTKLLRLCEEAVEAYRVKRGNAIWEHRAVGLGQIPGRARYETLRIAGFRCELCGIAGDERALDVDHIVPRKHGGSDEPENLQVLCWLCNTNKGAGDDTNFRVVREAQSARAPACVFCAIEDKRVVGASAVAIAVRDKYPVTLLHTLVIPRRHVADYFDLHDSEVRAIHRLISEVRGAIQAADRSAEAFNIGVNSGAVAGQTVAHCHVHLIPRRAGDVPNPRGGIRWVIPEKGDYII
jgi:diadenosine tetraphosphate (Ap4A) HIT family hydrolase/5-methylcytosine-specific restriction endonuclease McrA